MAGFVTGITKRLTEADGPVDPGEWFEIRKLSAKQLKKAGKAKEHDAADTAKSFGGDVMAAIRSAKDSDEVKQAQADPLNNYDQWELLYAGIAEWSYEKVKLNPRSIDDLDEEITTFLAREIVTFSLPQRTEDERKNA